MSSDPRGPPPLSEGLKYKRVLHKDGYVYYHNKANGNSVWELPAGAIVVPNTPAEQAREDRIMEQLIRKRDEEEAERARLRAEAERAEEEVARRAAEEKARRIAKQEAEDRAMKSRLGSLEKEKERAELEKEINDRLYGAEERRKADEERQKQRLAEEARRQAEAQDKRQDASVLIFERELLPEARRVMAMSMAEVRAKFPTRAKAILFLSKLHPSKAEGNKPLEKTLTPLFRDLNAQLGYTFGKDVLIGQGKKCGGACKPPYHDYSKGKASAFVLTCIDPRYTFDVAYFLQHKKELHQDYDLFTLAGASVGATKKEWTKTFFDTLDLGLKLHGIKEVWCFDHLDCGMYKATFNLKKDLDPKIHIQCMDKLQKIIKKKYPELKFRKFMVNAQGHVSSV